MLEHNSYKNAMNQSQVTLIIWKMWNVKN